MFGSDNTEIFLYLKEDASVESKQIIDYKQI